MAVPEKLGCAVRSGDWAGALPMFSPRAGKRRDEPLGIADSVRASVLEVLLGASDKDKTDAKLGNWSKASFGFGELLFEIMDSDGASVAESELEMDSVTIG